MTSKNGGPRDRAVRSRSAGLDAHARPVRPGEALGTPPLAVLPAQQPDNSPPAAAGSSASPNAGPWTARSPPPKKGLALLSDPG